MNPQNEHHRANPPDADDTAAHDAELGLAGFRQPAPEQGLSLDQLSGAFAELLSAGTDPYGQSDAPEGDPGDADPGPELPNEAVEVSPRTILEAILFVGSPANAPISSTQVAALMRGVRPAEIDDLIKELNASYTAEGCPYEIVGEGAGYRMKLRESFARVREKFYGRTREVSLSQAAIETLAIVAYNQPTTRDDVNKLRGHPSGSILSQLVRRQLLRLDRPEEKGQPPLYSTTERFLQLFGLSSLEDLPRSDDLEKR